MDIYQLQAMKNWKIAMEKYLYLLYCAILINSAGEGTGDMLAEIFSPATSQGTRDKYSILAN